MASGTRLLLRLPPSLRQHFHFLAAQEPLAPQLRINGQQFLSNIQLRSFGLSSRFAKQANTIPRKITKRPPSPAKANQPPTAAPRSPQTNLGFIDTYDPALERILIYASPDHGAFFATSYLTGGFILLGAYTYADMFLRDKPGVTNSFLLKAMGAFTTVCVATFGTVFILAPTKMIKSISIVSAKASTGAGIVTPAPRMLRFEIKRALPFFKPDILETSPKKVFLDRNVPVTIQDINFISIPKAESRSFTERYFCAEKESQKKGVMGAVSSANKSLLNAWPALVREVRRMFLRDQMAYVEVEGNGRFKLDLQGCAMLDDGKPMHRIITADSDARPSISRWVNQIFRG